MFHTLYPSNIATSPEPFTVEINCCRCDDVVNMITQPLFKAFEDMSYVIGSPAMLQTLATSQLVQLNSIEDCGPIMFKFIYEDG